ncbi:zinc finger CCCH domain-containing protein 18-like [Elephas maximus indicus]|uniref:zinc finger CCCH domain-containing protein 18-like n=1 Tax=Elephas maximus indicus TaxID=99487 RepID=UPI0021160A63|nr:zinc finger CCCH domain-containing protein 18-like [Elephas maximus indicus]
MTRRPRAGIGGPCPSGSPAPGHGQQRFNSGGKKEGGDRGARSPTRLPCAPPPPPRLSRRQPRGCCYRCGRCRCRSSRTARATPSPPSTRPLAQDQQGSLSLFLSLHFSSLSSPGLSAPSPCPFLSSSRSLWQVWSCEVPASLSCRVYSSCAVREQPFPAPDGDGAGKERGKTSRRREI